MVAIYMGTITKRTTAKGEVRYRALVQVRKHDINYNQSRTFSKKTLAEAWIKKIELEIEVNPELLCQSKAKSNKQKLTLAAALEKYLSEVTDFGRSKRMGIRFLTQWPIGSILLHNLKRQDFTEHTLLRRSGYSAIGALPIASSTALQDLQYIKAVLSHAELVWGEKVDLFELEQAMKGLRNARIIARSLKRTYLPSTSELQLLTNHYYIRWMRGRTAVPMHLIMWFAIYSCRREAEITRLRLEDYNKNHQEWLVRDLKNPNGSKGNNKAFIVSKNAETLINELMKQDVRDKMLSLGGDSKLLVPLDSKTYAARWREGVKYLGLEGLRFHDLRHEGATRLAEDGLTIPQLQQYTLHDSWSSLERYVNLKRREERLDFSEAIENAKIHWKEITSN